MSVYLRSCSVHVLVCCVQNGDFSEGWVGVCFAMLHFYYFTFISVGVDVYVRMGVGVKGVTGLFHLFIMKPDFPQ